MVALSEHIPLKTKDYNIVLSPKNMFVCVSGFPALNITFEKIIDCKFVLEVQSKE